MKWDMALSKGNTKRKKQPRRTFSCTIHFLDKTTETYRLPADGKGIHLLMLAYKHENLFETRYFGLRYSARRDGSREWLVPSKMLSKQFKGIAGEIVLYFEVKLFPEYPSQIDDKQSSHLIFLQLWDSVLGGELPCQSTTISILIGYYLQATYGDFVSEAQDVFHLSQLQCRNHIPKDSYGQIVELHKLLIGLTADNARRIFLDHVRRLEFYGVDLHRAKDSHGKHLNLGISIKGVAVYHHDTKMNTFSWSKITKVYYKSDRFYIQLLREQPETFDTVVGFWLDNRHKAKALWTSCIEFHAFYFTGTSPNYQKINKGVLPRIRKILKTGSCYTITHCGQPAHQSNETWMAATYRRYDQLNKIQSLSSQTAPRKAWTSSSNTSIVKSGPDVTDTTQSDIHSFESPLPATAFVPSNLDQTIFFADDDIAEVEELPLYLTSHSPEETSCADSVIHTELNPDDCGLFGFNVRFQGERRPVAVSRVIPNSPADLSYPPVRLGDQLLSINGHLVSLMTGKEVVDLLKRAKHQKLQLTLQRSGGGYDCLDTDEQPLEFVMDKSDISVAQSVLEMVNGLRSGSLLSAFELLYRQRMELACKEAKADENLKKNRYGDIFPYDYNRVLLQSSPYGDYINASHVVVPVSDSLTPVRYIATQGPLPHTVEDFWCLVWDYEVRVVAMVTPESERGTLKCHRYWPDLGETVRAGEYVINCLQVTQFDSFLQRDFIVQNLLNEEVRKVVQVNYADWPDHGVPVSALHFAGFVRHVQNLVGDDSAEHLVVHCSAGIGRTGAFILLDTAIRCIRSGIPVDPLRVVRMMRDQRPMMVQTSSQFRYVCECIVDAARALRVV